MLAADEVEISRRSSKGDAEVSPEQIERALSAVLASSRFKDSQQLQTLLRFVVHEALHGDEHALKERLIGIHVFGRRPDYDTTGDPIVRSRMGLLRKRLSQFYESEEGARTAVHIEIPNGTYRPVFTARPVSEIQRREPVTVEAVPVRDMEDHRVDTVAIDVTTVSLTGSLLVEREPQRHRRLPLFLAIFAALSILAVTLWLYLRPTQSELDLLWSPIVNGKRSVYVYTGTMPIFEGSTPDSEAESAADLYQPLLVPEPPLPDRPGTGPDRVFFFGQGMLTGSVHADIQVTRLLDRYHRSAVMRSGADLPFNDLEGSPLILIGSFENYWTRVMNDKLPFYLDRSWGIRERDGDHRRWFNPLKAEMTSRMMEDYAIIFRVMDSKAGAPVLGIAGLSTCGTHAAADFVTSPGQLEVLKTIPREALATKNVELVLHISLVNCTPTSVDVIAQKVW